MPSARASRLVPATLVRAIVSLPLMLLATALWAAYAEHPTTTDLATQAMLLLFMGALLVNVVVSVVAILRERQVLDPPEPGASRWVSEREQGPGPPARQAKPPVTPQPPSEHAPAGQALSER